MVNLPDEAALKARFEELVAQGWVLYGESKPVRVLDQGFPFEFRVCPALLKKPQAPDAAVAESNDGTTSTLGPGSDIRNEPQIVISEINSTHILMFNKFCIHPCQLLLLTKDSYRRQQEPLDRADFQALRIVLQALKKPHYAFFNCGEESGSSRRHKHMQVFPRDSKHQDDTGFKLAIEHQEAKKMPVPPYTYFLHEFNQEQKESTGLPSAYDLYRVYCSLMNMYEIQFNKSNTDNLPHNLILVDEWMMVVPRASAGWQGLYANSPGMLGMVWVTHHEDMDRWISMGPANVLSMLGYQDRQSKPSPDIKINGMAEGSRGRIRSCSLVSDASSSAYLLNSVKSQTSEA